jgi:hypothetical protein
MSNLLQIDFRLVGSLPNITEDSASLAVDFIVFWETAYIRD